LALTVISILAENLQETGAVLRNDEIGHAFQFGNESSVRNILEKNWWESDEQMQENQMIADEVLKRDEERRRRRDEGVEEDEEMPQADEGRGQDACQCCFILAEAALLTM
jgi:hypothetical protein